MDRAICNRPVSRKARIAVNNIVLVSATDLECRSMVPTLTFGSERRLCHGYGREIQEVEYFVVVQLLAT